MVKVKTPTPFHVRGKLIFPWRPTADRAFIYPCPPPSTFISGGLIEIPDAHKHFYFQGVGVLLAIGPGYHDDEGRWHGVSSDLVPGAFVQFDSSVPWRHVQEAPDGKLYDLILCGARDIHGIVDFYES